MGTPTVVNVPCCRLYACNSVCCTDGPASGVKPVVSAPFFFFSCLCSRQQVNLFCIAPLLATAALLLPLRAPLLLPLLLPPSAPAAAAAGAVYSTSRVETSAEKDAKKEWTECVNVMAYGGAPLQKTSL